MSEEEKQIHLYMHSKNELGLATLCVEKDKEIERLKEMKLHTEKYASEMEDKYILEKNKNNKAIEYIENNTYKSNATEYMDLTGISELLDILKGVDKDEN